MASKTTTTILGAMGGASLALGSAGAGAKAGTAAGMIAGPVGMAAGAVLGGAAGFASYWVAKGISAMMTSDSSEDEAVGEPPDDQNDRESGGDDDREDESSASEDESQEDSTESSDYETYLMKILDRIARLPRDASVQTRISLFEELCEALNPVFHDLRNRVRIHRSDRNLVIHVPGFRNIEISTLIRDNLRLFEIEDLGDYLDSVDEQEQALVYLLRCRHCSRNYVGLSTQFPNRQSTHRSNVRRGNNSSPNQHLDNHRHRMGTPLTFDNSFIIFFLKGLPAEIKYRLNNKEIKKVLRSWEVFLQWLFKGRVADGGIGKR